MTAAYLKRALPSLESVTVLESASIKTIGVGEATFSTLKLFFDFLGLHERTGCRRATPRISSPLSSSTGLPAKATSITHSSALDVVDGLNAAEWWLKLRRDQPFDRVCFTIPAMRQAHRSPRASSTAPCLTTAFATTLLPIRAFQTNSSPITSFSIHTVIISMRRSSRGICRDYAMRHGAHHLVDDLTAAEKSRIR